jgi:hypothetical protein
MKFGATIVRHARNVTVELAHVAIPRQLFRELLRRIARLQVVPLVPETGL